MKVILISLALASLTLSTSPQAPATITPNGDSKEWTVERFEDKETQNLLESLKNEVTIALEDGTLKIVGLCNSCSVKYPADAYNFICTRKMCLDGSGNVEAKLTAILAASKLTFVSSDDTRIRVGEKDDFVVLMKGRIVTTPLSKEEVQTTGARLPAPYFYTIEFASNKKFDAFVWKRGMASRIWLQGNNLHVNICNTCIFNIDTLSEDPQCTKSACPVLISELEDWFLKIIKNKRVAKEFKRDYGKNSIYLGYETYAIIGRNTWKPSPNI